MWSWSNLKPQVTRVVMWTIKNHWIFLILIIAVQYLTGSWLAEPAKVPFPVSFRLIRQVHSLNGKFILAVAILLSLEKIYLFLLKKSKI